MQKIFQNIVKEAVNPLLKSAGFSKKNLNFYRKRVGLTEVINLQRSKWNSEENVDFFINVGIYSAEIEAILGNEIIEFPKEYECHFEQRIEQIAPFGSDRFVISTETDFAVFNQYLENILQKTLIFLDEIKNLDHFCDLLIAKNGLHNYEKIIPFLMKTNRAEKADFYIKDLEKRLKNDALLAFFQAKISVFRLKLSF